MKFLQPKKYYTTQTNTPNSNNPDMEENCPHEKLKLPETMTKNQYAW
jgi:hypothetical protein